MRCSVCAISGIQTQVSLRPFKVCTVTRRCRRQEYDARQRPVASLSLYLFTQPSLVCFTMHVAFLVSRSCATGSAHSPLAENVFRARGGTGEGQCHARFRHNSDEKDSSAELGDGNLMCAKTSNPSSKRFLLTDSVVNSLGFSKFREFSFAERFKYAATRTPRDAV